MKLDQSVVQSRLALCAAAMAGAAASSADAAIVTFTTPVAAPVFSGVVPNTFDGIYLNLTSAANGTSGGSVAGWDFNPYNSGTALSFFWNGAVLNLGGVASSTTGPYVDMSAGGIVGPTSTFAKVTATAATIPFQSPGLHVLGFGFLNEGTGVTNFGYMVLESAGTNGFPLTIRSWSYEDTGAEITVPAIPAPAALAPLSMAALALGGRRSRRIA